MGIIMIHLKQTKNSKNVFLYPLKLFNMRKIILAFSLCSFFACSKAPDNPRAQISENENSSDQPSAQRPPGPIGGGGVVAAQPTYLIPTGGSTYTCQYAGLTVNFTSTSYPSNVPYTRIFNDYGTYYTVDGYANATTTSSNASGGGSGNFFTFTEFYCAGVDQNSLCTNWLTRDVSGFLVRVLNPQPGAPSFLALVPPSYFVTGPIPVD
jgi:hypothetical protein